MRTGICDAHPGVHTYLANPNVDNHHPCAGWMDYEPFVQTSAGTGTPVVFDTGLNEIGLTELD